MRAQASVTFASCFITLMAFFSMSTASFQAKEKGFFDVVKITSAQPTAQIIAHRGSGRVEYKVGQFA